jgi:hypothetical protein
MDTLTRKPRYGLRSKLINQLLAEWLDKNPTMLDSPPLTEAEIDAIYTPTQLNHENAE